MTFSKSIIAITGLAVLASCGNNSTTTPVTPANNTPAEAATPTVTVEQPTVTPSTEVVQPTTNNVTTTEHKGNIAYTIPAGEVVAEFEIEIDSNGNIVDAGADLVSLPAGDQMSEMMIEHFDEEIDKLIVGKKLADIQALNAVAGASVTTDAFKKFASTIVQ